MPRKPVMDRACLNPDCVLHGQAGRGNIIRHSFIRLRRGRSRRYLCKACGKTFSSSTATPYHRLHYYNFVRSHLALKFGSEVRNPAMQAGLVAKRLTFR